MSRRLRLPPIDLQRLSSSARKVCTVLALVCFPACMAATLEPHAPWVEARELNALLPDSVRVFRLDDEQLRLRAWYVRADLSDPALAARVVVADDKDRRESVSSLAEQAGACVTVNGGYFTQDTEIARHEGLLRVAGELVEGSKDNNPALGFTSDGRPDIAWVCTQKGEVVELAHGPVQPGDSARPPERIASVKWPMRELLHGRPALIFDGVPYHHKIEERHPRTAAGIDADGNLILMVVDGRQRASRGVTFAELTTLMLDVGCVEALNLDGGGSSTLVIGDELINRPTGDTNQREVMSAVALVREP